MRPLSIDDLMPLEEYASRRREFFESQCRYLDRYRRVRVGPAVTIVFENRQTLWFRVQELFRVARLAEPERVGEELEIHNRLLPGLHELCAALIVDESNHAGKAADRSRWASLSGDEIRLHVGPHSMNASIVTCRPEDRAIGAAHWIQFSLDPDARKALPYRKQLAWLEIEHGDYHHASLAFNDDIRQSLLDDLRLSDRDQG